MLLNAVIIILQEVLEAALLISVLMAISHTLQLNLNWLKIAVITGFIGAFIYQYNLESISSAFDYVGQEVTNALMQASVYISLVMTVFFINRTVSAHQEKMLTVFMSLSVSLGIIREGSEIFIYIGSFIQQDHLSSVCIGGGIGAAIGASLAALIYYTLINAPKPVLLVGGQLLLSLIAAAMLSQATQLLTQADWLPAHGAVWDSSSLISEESITGHLLYAIAGYEATPAPIQLAAYITGLSSIILLIASKEWLKGKYQHA